MIKKTILAMAALGLIGSVSLIPVAPAEAFFFCGKKATHKKGSWCERRTHKKVKRVTVRKPLKIWHGRDKRK
jgi:hypothetical protein